MAKRRALARALAGLGEGIANASGLYLRHRQQQDLQDRYDKRQDAAAKASADRANQAELDRVEREIRMKIASGDLDANQGAVMLSQLTQEAVTPDALEPIRPSLTKRLGKKFDPLMDAQFPEGLPTDEEIATAARDEGGALPIEQFMIGTPHSGDAFMGFKPEVADYARGVGARRRSLMARPTERIKQTLPSGAEVERTTNPYDMQSGVTVTPDAATRGQIAGTERTSFLETAGEAEAQQAGNVAGATEDARNTPGRQQARTREAVDREVQVMRQTLPYKLDLARQTAALEIQQAVNKEHAINVSGAIKASSALMGPQFFDKVVDITRSLNNQDGLDARIKGAGTTVAYYLGGAPELKELNQLVSQNRRLLGQAFGVTEGNPSDKDMENVRTAIGLDQWSTTTERMNALRHLQDMISIGPMVAARLPANADMATRIELAKKFATARREAEDAAVAAGAAEYNDPVTNTVIKVIK